MEADAMASEPLVQPSKDGDVLLKQTRPNPLQYSDVASSLWMKLYGPFRPCGQDGGHPVLWSHYVVQYLLVSSPHSFHTRLTIVAVCPVTVL